MGFDCRAVRVERRVHFLLLSLDVPQCMIAIGHGVTQVGETMRDAIELSLRLTDHLPRLIELGRRCRCLARARDGVQLRLIPLFELTILIEPAADIALPALLRFDRLTSLIERHRGALLLFVNGVQPRPQRREALLQSVNLYVVCLYGEQRRDVWMHSAPFNSRCRCAKRLETPAPQCLHLPQ